jgi:hypothetical protein
VAQLARRLDLLVEEEGRQGGQFALPTKLQKSFFSNLVVVANWLRQQGVNLPPRVRIRKSPQPTEDCQSLDGAAIWGRYFSFAVLGRVAEENITKSRVAEPKLFFPLWLRLSKSFGSGSPAGSGNSLGTTCYHRFYVKKDIFHVFNERKST